MRTDKTLKSHSTSQYTSCQELNSAMSDSPPSTPVSTPGTPTSPTPPEDGGLPDNPLSSVPRPRLSRVRTFSVSSVGSYKRVVVLAVDASDHAKYSFEWFLEHIHRPDDLMIIIHCPEPPSLPSFSFKNPIAPPINEWKEMLDEMNLKTRTLEEDYEGTCIQKKLKYKMRGESSKKPGEYIVRISEEEDAALICMGTRGLSAMKRVLIGSVSDYVVRQSSVPVVVVPKASTRKRSTISPLV